VLVLSVRRENRIMDEPGITGRIKHEQASRVTHTVFTQSTPKDSLLRKGMKKCFANYKGQAN
jgi:hypothetical protein